MGFRMKKDEKICGNHFRQAFGRGPKGQHFVPDPNYDRSLSKSRNGIGFGAVRNK